MGIGRLTVQILAPVFVLVITCSLTMAQVLPFRFYSMRNGLPSNNITALCQDSLGDIWIGTNDGASMFDGREFHPFGLREGLSHQRVNDLISDREKAGCVWIGTEDGLCRYEHGRLSVVYGPPLHPASAINALFQDHAYRLWFAVNDTLMCYESGSVRTLPTPQPLQGTGQICETGDSLIWISHASGLFCYSLRAKSWIIASSGPLRNHGKRCMGVDRHGDLWVHRLSDGGEYSTILRISGTNILERRRLSARPGIAFLVDDGEGGLIVGSSAGVERMLIADSVSILHPHITSENGLPEDYLRTALIDREGNLWLGTNARGIATLSDMSVVRIPLHGMESGYRSTVASVDLHDHLWVISRETLVEVFSDRKQRWQLATHPLTEPAVSLEVDRHGYLWIAFRNGSLSRYAIQLSGEGRATLIQTAQFNAGRDFPAGFPVTFTLDNRDRVWYAISGVGLCLLDPASKIPLVNTFDSAAGIPENYVRTLLADSHGRLWWGSYSDGLSYLTITHPTTSVRTPLSIEQRIRSLLEDRSGNIWVGTRSGGLAVFDGTAWHVVTVREGLPSNTIWGMSQDYNGHIWLATAAGAVRVDSFSPLRIHRKPELSRDGTFATGSFRVGKLWFLTVEGITVYDPVRERKALPPPKIHITGLQVNGTSVEFAGTVSLPAGRNTCTIDFVGPSFMEEREVLYRYRMRPQDTAWVGPVSTPRVTFGSLPSGEHLFEVEAINAAGMYSMQPARLSITIVPPFWTRDWFIVLLMGLLILGVTGTIRALELRKIRERMRRLEQQQALERERLRIARDMHDQIGSTLTEIAILSELARQPALGSGEAGRHLSSIAGKSREVLDNIGEIIWAINPRNDQLDNLAAYVRNFVLRYTETAGLGCDLDIQDPMPTAHLSVELRRNIFLVVKEAIHNVVKHAGATRVVIRLKVADSRLELTIADDGRGFDASTARPGGNGLTSMKQRAADAGGSLRIESESGRGTSLYLIFGIAKSAGKK